jgi:hypothetical protein
LLADGPPAAASGDRAVPEEGVPSADAGFVSGGVLASIWVCFRSGHFPVVPLT